MVQLLKENKIFAMFLFLLFAAYFSTVFLPIEKILSYFVIDDAFYYFKIASNIAKGLGPTFDGEHFTNGYHPLWMGLLALIYYFIPADKILAVKVILGLSAVLYFFTALIVWRIINFFIKDRIVQYILLGAYVLNPWNLTFYLNGLETPLSLLFFSWLILICLEIFSGQDSDKNFILAGIISGLLILARLDYGLFAAFTVLAIIWKRGSDWQKLTWFCLPAALLAGPWFLYNKIYFGSFFPTSGLAYTLINHRLFFYKSRSLARIILWSIYNFGGALAFSLQTIGLPMSRYAIEAWARSAAWLLLFAGFLASPVIYLWKRKGLGFLKSAGWTIFAIFFLGFLSLALVHGGIRWSNRPWYFSIFPIVAILFAVLLISEEPFSFYQKRISVFFLIFYLISYGFYAKDIFFQQANQADMYRLAVWARNHLPENARMASFNSGIMGYFSGRFVLNADGLVNQQAYEAMKENRLWEFFQKSNINYIIDYEIALTYRYKSFLGIDNPIERLKKLDVSGFPTEGNYGGSNLAVYEL
ncbi:MAG: hypothetical protein HYY86_00830 [Candidatus Harrisonbacteria bacterium]|nr:hypothetical protein [Candidatus Harrisonbacteria bacterium]